MALSQEILYNNNWTLSKRVYCVTHSSFQGETCLFVTILVFFGGGKIARVKGEGGKCDWGPKCEIYKKKQ